MKNKSSFEHSYKKLIADVISDGILSDNRTGIKTVKLLNRFIRINMNDGFPIVTGKKTFFDKGLHEFIWIYSGKTGLKYLHEHGIHWWDKFLKNGILGRIYGYQLRYFSGTFDQVEYAINEIKSNSRRAVISLWNPTDLESQALPVCYTQMIFMRAENSLSINISFRSSDLFLGLPYDIIFSALMLQTIADAVELEAGEIFINIADAHIYAPHLEAAKKYCKSNIHKLPKLVGTYPDFTLDGYISENFIKADLII
jgi:thymidylate synthase